MEEERTQRNAELYAEAFDNSDLANRSEFSIFRGSEEITSKNIHRHVVKMNSLASLRNMGRLRRTVAKMMLANSFLAGMKPASTKTDMDDTRTVVNPDEVTPKSKFARAPLRKAASMSSRSLGKEINKASKGQQVKKRKSWVAVGDDGANTKIFDDLRQIYVEGNDQATASLEEPDGETSKMYSDISLLQRESIRFEPELHIVLGELYDAVDSNRNGFIDKEEYCELIKLLYYCLKGFWDASMPDQTEKGLAEIANKDWQSDSQGYDFINYDRLVEYEISHSKSNLSTCVHTFSDSQLRSLSSVTCGRTTSTSSHTSSSSPA